MQLEVPSEAIGNSDNAVQRLSGRNCVNNRLRPEKGVREHGVAVDTMAKRDKLPVVDEQNLRTSDVSNGSGRVQIDVV